METTVNRSLNQNLAVLHYYVGLYKYRKFQRRTCNIGDSSDLTHKVAIVVGGAGGVGRAGSGLG